MIGEEQKHGVIARYIDRYAKLLYHLIAVGIFGRVLTSYDASDRLFAGSRLARRRPTGLRAGARRGGRRTLAYVMERNVLQRVTRRLVDNVCLYNMRTLGVFFVTMGAFTLMMYFLSALVWEGRDAVAAAFVVGVAGVTLGVPMLFSDRSFGYLLRRGAFFRFMLTVALGISDSTLRDVEPKGRSGMLAALPFGVLAGVVFSFLNPVYVLVVLLLILFTALVLSVPESGVLLLLFALPLSGFMTHGRELIFFLFFLLFVGYLIKWICGNRTFRLEVQDYPVLLLLVLFLFSGISAAGSEARVSALFCAVALVAYFLAVNMMATPGWLARGRVVLSASGALTAAIGVAQFVAAAVKAAPGTGMATLGRSVRAGFSSHVSFAWFLVIAFAFLFPSLWEFTRKQRWLGIAACVLMLGGAVLSGVQSAPAAFVLIMLTFALLYHHRALPITLFSVGVVSAVTAMLPTALSGRLLSLLREPDRLARQRSATARVLSRIFFGDGGGEVFDQGHGVRRFLFGMGRGSLTMIYPAFTDTGTAFEPAVCNFFMGFVAEFGVLALIVPLALFFLLLQNCFTALASAVSRDEARPAAAFAGIGLTVASLLYACFHYTWADPAAFALLLVALALICASLRYERARTAPVGTEETEDGKRAELDYRVRAEL